MKIGVIVAMGAEFKQIEALLTDKKEQKAGNNFFVEGCLEDKEIVLLQSGIGKVFSAVGTLEMIKNFQPDCIINTGVAGGIDSELQIMDVVVGNKIVYHDVWCGDENEYGQVQGMPAYYEPDGRLYEQALKIESEVPVHGGMICSGDRFVTSRQELHEIKVRFPKGLAVDMESCSIAQVCYMYSVPFLSFRIISDTPGVERHIEQYRDFWTLAPQRSFQVFKQLIKGV
ncbi:5'-methylthioadenosine/adenosylhomocysteine nucleosidase [Odoribacter lunatus]|uniref:5'-methylthioadenosine/adenosylhomocysteine nucleosidase n=1 Tax=Odoribacter lunatus TaxID=2941335 RepID=UPI002040774B|nr:5'-methylthioadenosine/adenosylhomocysteine nucleosidase [Odoribacter lunatus]